MTTDEQNGPSASALEVIVLDAAHDNVGVAVRALAAGDVVETDRGAIAIATAIPSGHKLALTEIGDGEPILKYGEVIGRATSAIAVGQHVHVHNVVSDRLPGPDDA
jgi:altronate dehydratase